MKYEEDKTECYNSFLNINFFFSCIIWKGLPNGQFFQYEYLLRKISWQVPTIFSNRNKFQGKGFTTFERKSKEYFCMIKGILKKGLCRNPEKLMILMHRVCTKSKEKKFVKENKADKN